MNIKEDFKTLFKIIKIFVTIVKLVLYIKAYYDKNTKEDLAVIGRIFFKTFFNIP